MKTMSVLIALMIATLVVMPTGCVKKETLESKNEDGSQVAVPFLGWWEPEWSEDGANLSIRYTQGRNTLSTVIHVGNSFGSSGVQIKGNETRHSEGEDIYGREQDTIIGTASMFHGGSVKPESEIANGTFIYPAGQEFEQSLFARSFKVTISYEYNDKGQLKGGTGTEEISGHISTSVDKIAYTGIATGTFTTEYGQLVWTERTEKTNYYYKDKLYAETVTVITPQSKYIGGKFRILQETVKTTTAYADGSKRESEIVVLYQRNENGKLENKSATGVVTGVDLINGKPIDYSGSITIDYAFDYKVGWHKVGYNEKRSAEIELLKTLPFEVIFIDDPYLRPVF